MSLTIKQAFEALSDACANGMKNPFFVMRRLKESFADVASKVVDASGDKVTVTQTLTEGTEIGSIKVNNNTTTLYAPAGGSGGLDYSTTEQDTGLKWIDNKSVYVKTIIAAGPSGNLEIDTGLTNVDTVVEMSVIMSRNDNSNTVSSTYINISDMSWCTEAYLSADRTKFIVKNNKTSMKDIIVVIKYTKTST